MCIDPRFPVWMTNDKRLSPVTVQIYLANVTRALQWGVFGLDLANYIRTLPNRSPEWTNQYLSALRAYGQFLISVGLATENPTLSARMVKVPERLPKPFEWDDIKLLFSTIETAEQTPNVIQERFILESLYGSGLRQTELANLTLGQCQPDSIRIIGKGNKERQTIMTASQWNVLGLHAITTVGDERTRELVEAIDQSAALRDLCKRKPDWPILWSNPTLPVMALRDSRRWISRRCQFWFERAGITVKNSPNPHRLRHSFGTQLLDGGSDIKTVQTLFGHKDIRTTSGYLKVTKNSYSRARVAIGR